MRLKRLFPPFKHLNTRIVLCYSVLILLSFALLVSLTVQLYSQQLLEEMDNVLTRKLSLIDVTLSKTLDEVQSAHFSIMNNQIVTGTLERAANGGELSEEELDLLNETLSLYRDSSPILRTAIVLDIHDHVLQPFYAFYAEQILQEPAYQTLMLSQATRALSAPNHFPILTNVENDTILYFGKIYDSRSQYRTLGTLMLQLKYGHLFSPLGSLVKDSFELCLVLDEKNRVIATLGALANQQGLVEAARSGATSYENEDFRTYCLALNAYPNWRVVCLQSEQVFAGRLDDLAQVVMWLSLASLVFVVTISYSISNRITRPLKMLKDAMGRLGTASRTHEWPEPLVADGRDEIHDLVMGFNDMASDIHRLTEENAAQSEREKKMEVESLQMELDILQLQINPHFIHNTLNAMHYMALESDTKRLASMIASFNALLRNSFSQNGPHITVLEELGNLDNYLHIQKERYDFPIHFNHDVEPELSFAMLPRLILQPLVENALFHGLVPARGGTVTVLFTREGERMNIRVEDDGVGISPEIQASVLRMEFQNPKSYNSFGMKNVNERLKLLYGPDSCLHIGSGAKGGTVVSFQIPIELKF